MFNLCWNSLLGVFNWMTKKRATSCTLINLAWRKNSIKNQIDSIISAVFPNAEEDPVLFNVLKKDMIHGPCGRINPISPCMKDGKYTKKFFKAETSVWWILVSSNLMLCRFPRACSFIADRFRQWFFMSAWCLVSLLSTLVDISIGLSLQYK